MSHLVLHCLNLSELPIRQPLQLLLGFQDDIPKLRHVHTVRVQRLQNSSALILHYDWSRASLRRNPDAFSTSLGFYFSGRSTPEKNSPSR